MRFLPFVFKHLRQHWIRTASTVAAMAVCIFLFCTLQGFLGAVHRMIEGRSPRRLITRHAVSPIFPLPLSHREKIRAVPGVRRVAATVIFGGLMPAAKEGAADASSGSTTDWTDFFPNAAVDAEPYFAMRPELRVPPEQFRGFLGDLQGCLIGRKLADKFGWRIGDRFFLESVAPPLRKRSGPFEFVVRGIFDADHAQYPGTDTNFMFFHFKYLNEAIGGQWTGMYTVEVDDPGRAGEASAAIDALFENSSDQTYTESEKAFLADAMSLSGNLALLLNGIGLAASFTILLVTANTMSMAVRERRTEIAVLKTLGFSSGRVMGLIVLEGLLLGMLGGGLGVAAAKLVLALTRLPGAAALLLVSDVDLGTPEAVVGLGVALLLGFAAGFMPAWSAYRARITDMLRTV